MQNSRFWLLLLLSLLQSAHGYDAAELFTRPIHFASVPFTDTAPILDGRLDEAVWSKAATINDFVLTAGDYGKPATYQTTAYLLYDDAHLFVAFRCSEPEIENIKTTSVFFDDPDILYDDRVEVFVDVDHDHRRYYELAVNPKGNQFDQECYNRLHGSKTCDMNPGWSGFWRAKTSISAKEWSAEIAIDVTSMGMTKLEPGMTWGFNLARVRQPDVQEGDEFFKREPDKGAEYSAWAPVNDYIRETISNFHAPIEFGDLVFGDPGFVVKEFRLRSAQYAFGPVGFPSLFGNNPLEMKVDVDSGKTKDVLARITVEPESAEDWIGEEKVTLTSAEKVVLNYYIPENQENKIILQLLDPQTKKQLYRTSYIELAPPFIEFDLEPLYARNLSPVYPVLFKLLTDEKTLTDATLECSFKDSNGQSISSARFDDLTKADRFAPLFSNIDELRGLPGGNYVVDCQLLDKQKKQLARFRQNLTKFENSLPDHFFAEEGNYNYGGISNHAVRIRYPFPAEFVFCRSASYIPIWDCDQAAMTNEFIECWGAGNQGCSEPMQDRECRYSRVRILENSPARVVVHWRYALSDPHYRIYNNEWVDEYYVMYPDGVGVRQVNLWPNSNTRHEMFEVLLAKPPGLRTQQLYDEEFATLTSLKGERHSNKDFIGSKKSYQQFLASDESFIIEIHFKHRMHPFTVFSFRDELLPGVPRDHVTAVSKEMESADQRGHWPASRYQIDGYNTVGLDVPNHGNIGNIQAEIDPKNQPTTWTFLIGVKEKDSNIDRKHAFSWLHPAEVQVRRGAFQSTGFDPSQRAYVLKAQDFSAKCEMALATGKEGIVNPVFRFDAPVGKVKGVTLNGKKIGNFKAYKGHQNQMIVFIHAQLDGQNSIGFEFEKSGTQVSTK